jgi:hypothetical protein
MNRDPPQNTYVPSRQLAYSAEGWGLMEVQCPPLETIYLLSMDPDSSRPTAKSSWLVLPWSYPFLGWVCLPHCPPLSHLILSKQEPYSILEVSHFTSWHSGTSQIKQFQFPLWLVVSSNKGCGIQRTLFGSAFTTRSGSTTNSHLAKGQWTQRFLGTLTGDPVFMTYLGLKCCLYFSSVDSIL